MCVLILAVEQSELIVLHKSHGRLNRSQTALMQWKQTVVTSVNGSVHLTLRASDILNTYPYLQPFSRWLSRRRKHSVCFAAITLSFHDTHVRWVPQYPKQTLECKAISSCTSVTADREAHDGGIPSSTHILPPPANTHSTAVTCIVIQTLFKPGRMYVHYACITHLHTIHVLAELPW